MLTNDRLDADGNEVLDRTPIAIPAGFKRPESLQEQIQRCVRHSLSEMSAAAGGETFEEADDFEVDDEVDPASPYETFFDPVLGRDFTPREFQEREQEIREKYLRAQQQYFDDMDRMEAVKKRPGSSQAAPEPRGAGGPPPASTPPVRPPSGENGAT